MMATGDHENCPYLAIMLPTFFCTKCGWGDESAGAAATKDLLRRALKHHDVVATALRPGTRTARLNKALEDMKALKLEAADLGCYPHASDVLRHAPDLSGTADHGGER